MKCKYGGPCSNMTDCKGRHYCESQEHMKGVRKNIQTSLAAEKQKPKRK